ncbi:MAG: hypothetical protein LBH64_02570 [Coriobacteriales bacterium]|nr:hypothetical protein [Coriobacteriales bacterium]
MSAGAADNEQSVGDAEDVAGTGAANSEAVQDDRMTEIVEPNIPLSIRPYETGWSVVSLFASLITVIIGVVLTVLSVLRRSRKRHASNRLGLAIFGMAAAIVSTILFTSTEELQSQMILADSFTPVHVAMMAVAILCAFLFAKKETEELFSDNIPADNFR